MNLVSLFVTYQVFTVFPFDFSRSGFDWTLTARIVLILAMIGVAVGMLTEAIRLTQSAMTKRTA
jgi:hypothetical protein